MNKHTYRSVSIKQIDAALLLERLNGGGVVLGIDVAKELMVTAVMNRACEMMGLIKWSHPTQSRLFLKFVGTLQSAGLNVEVAMEPSGVYGDALRYALQRHGARVYRVSPKRSHDAAEVYDGVPSLFDPKSAAIVAKLHLDGASEPWDYESDDRRQLAALLRVLEIHSKELLRNRNRIEGYLARHWPELGRLADTSSATVLELLSVYGGPRGVRTDSQGAVELMRQISRGFLSDEVITRIIDSARDSFGVLAVAEEEHLIRLVAAEARRAQRLARQARKRVEKLTERIPTTDALARVVGKTTAAVVVAAVGDPANFSSARAFVKSAGLNLKEKSSGKHKGALHITKRGSGVARMHLYLAVLRLIQSEPLVRAWYVKKVSRQGGTYRSRAVVALMRKLLKALWHVGRGSKFDAAKLFDTRRLKYQLAQHHVPLEELFSSAARKGNAR